MFEDKISAARERELGHDVTAFPLGSCHGEFRPGGLDLYNYREGLPRDLGLDEAGQEFLAAHPGSNLGDRAGDTLFRQGRRPGEYRRLSLLPTFYDTAVRRARTLLFLVLGVIYILSIVALEFCDHAPVCLPAAAADARRGRRYLRADRINELIDPAYILDDEIGQIMSSRNETVAQLRRQEDHLASALRQLEEQDRLVSLGLLSTSVAHELNTPLAVLQGSIEKLIETNVGAAYPGAIGSNAARNAALAQNQRKPSRFRPAAQG